MGYERTGSVGLTLAESGWERVRKERTFTDVVVCTDCGGLVAADLTSVHDPVCPAPRATVRQRKDGSWPERPDTPRPVTFVKDPRSSSYPPDSREGDEMVFGAAG